jgi:hypothetical protein
MWSNTSIVWMYHSFIYLSTEGNLGSFQVLVVINKAAMNIHVQAFIGPKIPTPLGKY